MSGAPRRWSLVLSVAAATVLAACGATEGEPAVPQGAHFAGTSDVRAGVTADVYLPDQQGPGAVVVLVPGGGWSEADRTGLDPLAEQLAGSGHLVVNTTYRAADAGASFPTPVQDVACAVGLAAARAREEGRDGGPLVVVGHSAGAHLSALVALAPDRFSGRCRYPQATVDALVGLSGPYDITRMPNIAQPLFGASRPDAPEQWRAGNPLTWSADRPELPALLVHGRDDPLVPPSYTKQFADALRDGGHQVDVELVRGADHETYRDNRAGTLLTAWIGDLAAETP